VTLRDWITAFPAPSIATTATTATDRAVRPVVSQQSQLSQHLGNSDGNATEAVAPNLSQLSQLSQRARDFLPSKSDPANLEQDSPESRRSVPYALRQQRQLRQQDASPLEHWGDLRPCLWCQNLTPTGRCLAAWRGELRAARDYTPTFPGQPRRCIGYDPEVDDPDRSSGRERWPELVESQAPRESATRGKPMEARSRSNEVA
jgi:hypothetical protein